MARPSSFSQDIADTICERLADGESLRTICASEAMPKRSTVFRWLNEREEFRSQYARAREEQAEALADEIVAISDGDGTEENPSDPQRDKLRVDARKWAAAKLLPKKFGDSVQLKHADADGNKVDLADAPAAARLAALLEAVRQRAADDGSSAGQASEPQG